MSRLLVIPARGGSKRVPRKNMHLFGNIPALHRTIELALSSELFDLIVISSDDEETLSSVLHYPVDASEKRPSGLANDTATVTDVMKFEVAKLLESGKAFDEVWQLSSFAFLLSTEDLLRFASRVCDLPKDGLLIGVLPFPTPLEWALERNEQGELKPLRQETLTSPSQKFKKHFFDSGAIAIFKGEIFQDLNFQVENLRIYGEEVGSHKVVDVDEPQDLLTLEVLFLGNLEAKKLGLQI